MLTAMNTFLAHETLHRGPDLMSRIADFPITLCGAGALGANVAENLVRSGFGSLCVVDCDRIEERNLSTQPWNYNEIGGFKATILANNLYRATRTEITSITRELTGQNIGKLLSSAELVVDLFDNSVSRRTVKEWSEEIGTPCLHAGLTTDYAEVIWNMEYRVPSPTNDDVCDYPLARNLVMMTAALVCETIVRFVETGEQRSRTLTFGDFAIKEITPTGQER